MSLDINAKTDKGWTNAEESTFAEIMRVGRMARIPAIHLYKRCRCNSEKAVKYAREFYAPTEAQVRAYEQTRTKRLAVLTGARPGRRKAYPSSTSEIALQLTKETGSGNMPSST
jgi:hypothetical protein